MDAVQAQTADGVFGNAEHQQVRRYHTYYDSFDGFGCEQILAGQRVQRRTHDAYKNNFSGQEPEQRAR